MLNAPVAARRTGGATRIQSVDTGRQLGLLGGGTAQGARALTPSRGCR